MFKGKKILFFSASFFGYQDEIKNKLVSLGAEVDFYDERPKNTFWYKALIRIDKRIIKHKIEKYYTEIIKNTEHKDYDYVFFLKAEVITLKTLKKLKEKQNKAQFILYLWDSIKNCESVEKLFPLFDKILSFDRKDVEKNEFMHFRPLFYLDEYILVGEKKPIAQYDLTFIGTGHTDRYQLVTKIKDFCTKNHLRGYFFIYLQDLKIFFARKLLQKNFKNANLKEFSFKPIGKSQILEIIEKSNCILDIERAVQCGLTMRTIEILGAKRKLITTNADIENYDFYHKSNIHIIDRKNPEISIDFMRGSYVDISRDIYEKYNLDCWLFDVFK